LSSSWLLAVLQVAKILSVASRITYDLVERYGQVFHLVWRL